MSETTDQSVEDIWQRTGQCVVCGKPLDPSARPQLLPCCHSSCGDCLDDNRNQLNEWEARQANSSPDKPQFKCKICDQEYNPMECIDNLFQLKHWSKTKSNPETHYCQSCDGERRTAVVRCETCDWICDNCDDVHKKIKALKSHVLDESSRVLASEQSNSNICQIHNEEITVYCKTCRSPYCARCILKDHNVHVYEDTKDGSQLQAFFDMINRLVDKVKEKRIISENVLENYGKFEPQLNEQKDECTNQVKQIVQRLQEKVSELGTNLLETVNNICQQKESDFNKKKNELRQLTSSLKFTEEFISAALQMNDAMNLMKAQDLLTTQLNRLLSHQCTQPDFDSTYKVQVVDRLIQSTDGLNKFDACAMIEGVFKQCFKIVTKEELERAQRANRSVSQDEEVTYIGQMTGNNGNHQLGPYGTTYGRSVRALSTGTDANRPSILRGNRYLHQSVSDVRRTSFSPPITSYANPMQSSIPSNSHLSNHSYQRYLSPLQSLSNCTHSVPSNNFIPQTGISPNTYSNPPAYRQPVTPQPRTVQNVANTTYTTYTQPPNNPTGSALLAAIAGNNYGAQGGTTRPTIVYPTSTQSSNALLLSQLTSPYLPNQSIRPQVRQQPLVQKIAISTAERQKRKDIETIAQQLKDLSPNPTTSNSSYAQNVCQIMSQIQNPINTNNTRPITQTQMATQSTHTNTLPPTITSVFASNSSGVYQLHVPEGNSGKAFARVVTPPPAPEQTQQRSASTDSNCQRQENITQTTMQSIVTSNQTIVQTPVTISVPTSTPSPPTISPYFSMPIVSNIEKSLNTNSEQQNPLTENDNQSAEQQRNDKQITACEDIPNQNSTVEPRTDPTVEPRTDPTVEPRTDPTVEPSLPVPITDASGLPSDLDDLFSELSSNSIGGRNSPHLSDINSPENSLETSPVGSAQNNSEDSLICNEISPPSPPEEAAPEGVAPEVTAPEVTVPQAINSEVTTPKGINSEVTATEATDSEMNSIKEENSENIENTGSNRTSEIPVARVPPITNEPNDDRVIEEITIGDDSDSEASYDDDADCVVCTKPYGEFICCGDCPKGFHLKCHVPQLNKMPETSFTCAICKVKKKPNEETEKKSTGKRRKAGLNDRQQLTCEAVLLAMLCHRNSRNFKKTDIKPQTINLLTIKQKLEKKEFNNEIQFIDDFKRMFRTFKGTEKVSPEDMNDCNVLEKYFKKNIHQMMPHFSEALHNNTINNIDSNSGSSSKKSK